MERRKGSIDMLSGLPDEVLHHILSFLTTKTSVCTCVLSKRWRFLWKHVPNLEFDGNHFRGKKMTQINIINRVIMLHEAKILNTFSCRLADAKGCAYQLETLIIYPITLGVRNLYLDFGFNYEDDIVCTFPRLLLTCKTLVDLRLVNCGVIPSTGELFLPSLKKLNLSYVDYESDESLPHLLSGCPVLEELIVCDCSRREQKNSGCVIVTSLTLKRLNVEFSNGDSQHLEEMLIIDVPALVNLKVGHCDLDSIKSLRKTMTSLDKAEIDICVDSHMCDIDCYEHDSSIEFLSCLCNVRYLKITSDLGPLVGIVGTGSMPMLVNLTKLQLNVAVNWYNVVKFLEIADNLEVLIIYAHKTIPCDEPVPYNEPKRVPTCMLSCLRTVRLYNVCEDTFDMVRYILRNAQVLDMMEISYLDSDKEKFDTLQRILFFERASKSCQVVFSIDKIVRDVINMLS